MSWTNFQKIYIMANGGAILIGKSALVFNGLVFGSDVITVYTNYAGLHRLDLTDVFLSHYHIDCDTDYMRCIDEENNVWVPTTERAIVDAVKFMYESYDEGVAIEAFQNYLRSNPDLDKLYEVADHYLVPRSDVDYWLNEAREETDMSMG